MVVTALVAMTMVSCKKDKKDEAVNELNRYTADFEAATAETWKEMEHKFWEMFWTGF